MGLFEKLFGGAESRSQHRPERAHSPTRRTNYVVIGELGSRDWKHTSFGRKIQKAVEVRSDGYPLAIVAEEHWAARL